MNSIFDCQHYIYLGLIESKDNSHVDVPSKSKRMTDEGLERRRDQVLTAYRKNKSTKVQPSVIDEEDDPYWPPRPMNHS